MWIALLSAVLAIPVPAESVPADGADQAPSAEDMPADAVVEEPGREYAATVVTTDDVLKLLPDGTVALERRFALMVPEPPPPEEGEEVEEEDVDEDSDLEDPGVWSTVRLAHPVASADAFTVTSELSVHEMELREVAVPVLDTQATMAEIDADRERLRQMIAASQESVKRDEVSPRPDLDLLESLLAGEDEVTHLTGEDRGEELVAYLSAQLEQATTTATLVLDGESLSATWLDLRTDTLEPGEYAIVLESVVPEARWVQGYVLDATPATGKVASNHLAGLSVPAELGFTDVDVTVDWGNGPIEAMQSPVTLKAGTELHTIRIGELPNTYRNIVGEDAIQRRVDIANPYEVPLPQMRATLSATPFTANALEPGETFRLGLGTATGWRVKRKGNEYDIRTYLPNPTPVWLPIDPTGCRIAASGDVLGMEEIDGNNGVAAVIGERGIVSVMCE